MSSFASLRVKKDKKSYVNVPTVPLAQSSATRSSTKDPVNATEDHDEPINQDLRGKEGLYATLPRWIEIRTSAEEGRGLWTTQGLKAGSTVLSMKPHIYAISNRYLNSYCSSCTSRSTIESINLQRCTKCRAVRYCNSECQTADWPVHKLECAAIQRWFQASESIDLPPSDAIRCIARLLWKRQKKGCDSVWAKEIDCMQSHRVSLSKGCQLDTKNIEDQTQLAHSLVQYLGVTAPQELSEQFGINSAGDLVDVISKFTTNAFTLSDPSLTPIGVCVSPSVALLNHSCDPNVVVVFPGAAENGNKKGQPLMEVVTIQDIAPEEELLTAYVDTTLPIYLRRKALKETYFFTCYCHLCGGKSGWRNPRDDQMDVDSETSLPDSRESLWCPKKCGGMCPLPNVESEDLSRVSASCTMCKTPIPHTTLEEVLDVVRIGKEGLEKAERLQYTEPAQVKRLTTNLILLLTSAGLSYSTHPLLAMMRLHGTLLIDELPTFMAKANSSSQDPGQEHLDECIRTSSKIVTGLSAILRPGHPVTGIAQAELGKLLAVDEAFVAVDSDSTGAAAAAAAAGSKFPPTGPARLKLAYDTLIRARASLRIGFGSRNDGGKVGGEVREDLVRLEKEIEVWKTGVRNVLGEMSR
ncbi:SET domain-containing protein [Marasmius fiardii PR-910]|nr:SET domain-containing protein [Marasmius fiardii PR-910]